MGNDKADGSTLRILTPDLRSRAYTKIADVHKGLLQAKWMASTKGGKLVLSADLMVHLEESIAFLAEDLLKLQAENEKRLDVLESAAEVVPDSIGKDSTEDVEI